MKQFLKKSVFGSVPFIIVLLLVVLVDPYNYFNYFDRLIPPQTKEQISKPINRTLGKIIRYKKKPSSNILLGDSRTAAFKPEYIFEISGDNYFNLAYGGGTLTEACRTFWWANKITELKKVYIGINFNHFNSNNVRDRVSGSIAITENPLLYLVNRNVVSASFRILWSMITNKIVDIEKPKISWSEFWDFKLNDITKRFYAHYVYPADLHTELKKVASHCKKKGIQLVFLVPPTHVSMQSRIDEFGLTKARERFLSDLKGLDTTVYDFDYPNEITTNKDNFRDPNHCKPKTIVKLIKQIWGNEEGVGKLYVNEVQF